MKLEVSRQTTGEQENKKRKGVEKRSSEHLELKLMKQWGEQGCVRKSQQKAQLHPVWEV